jgi:hypothetical protein
MEAKLSTAKDVEEFGRLFLEKYPDPVPYWSDELKQVYENKNWEAAKAFSTIYYWYITSYTSPEREERYFWADLKKNFAQTIKEYETKHALNWAKLLYAQLKFTKSAPSTVRSVRQSLKRLVDNNIITLNDTSSRSKIFFMAFELGAKFKEIQIRKYDKRSRKVVEYTESLEYYVATSKDICKSDRLNILEFLLVRGQLTLKPSGEKNIPAPFVLAERKNPMALRIFLLHPEIHKATDAEGRNILHYLAVHYRYMPYLKNFTIDKLKHMVKVGVEVTRGRTRTETPIDLYRTTAMHGQYPQIYLRAIQEAITEGLFGDLRGYEFYNSSRFHLGRFGQYILVDLGLWNGDLDGVRKNYAKVVRHDNQNELISPGDTTFAFHELPLETAHLICVELDYESRRSLFSVSKLTFALKARFSNLMYDSMLAKEFPMNVNYTVKGREGYYDVTSRYSNWKKGAYTVRHIEWADTRPSCEPKFWRMDENWLSFRTDRELKLWDCHNDQFHDLPGLSKDSTVALTYLDSRPGVVPVVVSYSLQGYSIFVSGRSGVQKQITAISTPGQGGYFIEAIGDDRVVAGGLGTVWNIEKEQAVGRLTLPSESMILGSYNPLNKLIFTAMNDSDQKVVALFDKNLQNVAKLENCKEASVDRFCFVDEYTSVLTSDHSYSSIWDLRMPDRPRQFINLTIDNTFCSRYGLTTKVDESQAVIWDLKTGLWEKLILLPEGIRYQPIGNSRYACLEMLRTPAFCLLDFQRTLFE